jgi:hypothetical protein
MTTETDDKSPSCLIFPEEEIERRKNLLALFDEWQTTMKGTLPPEQALRGGEFVCDGFYPYYFRQPMKILFVGKECLGLEGCDYLEVLLTSYRKAKSIGKQHLNTHKFHSRLLYVAYGLLNNYPEWKDIPCADKIGDTFATTDGISFAFMNVSKFSNETDYWQAQTDLMRSSVDASNVQRRFIEEEIALLEPDLVISMNLGSFLDALGTRNEEQRNPNVSRSRLTSHGHRSVLLDTWHFSYTKVKNVEQIYLPVCDAVKGALDDGWMRPRMVARIASNNC